MGRSFGLKIKRKREEGADADSVGDDSIIRCYYEDARASTHTSSAASILAFYGRIGIQYHPFM